MSTPLQVVERRFKQLRKLTEVSRALTYAVSLDEVLDITVTRAAEILETDRAVLMLTNRDGLLSVRASVGLDAGLTDKFSEPLDETLITRLQALLDVDPEHFLGVPLVVGGQVTGLVAVPLGKHQALSDEHEWILSALADQTSVALEKTRLDEVARFRERVIGIVSHDLRNPISAIVLNASALMKRDEVDARTTKIAARIHASADRAARMIRDLLDYTQAHLGNAIPVDRRAANVHAIANVALEELQASHPLRELRHDPSGDGDGSWDADRLAQVVGNLVSNAIAYSPASTPVLVETRGDDHEVTISVHNDGVPIPHERLPFIFEPMQRASLNQRASSRNVGLGLYIVKHLVDAHHGTVEVQSSEAEGTTFLVRLPRT